MTTRLKVVHTVLSLDCGGLERVVLDLLREGQVLGQDVAVLCLERPGALAGAAEALGVKVTCVHKRPGIRPGVVRPIRSELERLGPDVVHTHQVGALFYAGPAARRAAVPAVVHTEHGKNYGSLRKRLLGRLAARHARRFFCVSADLAEEVHAGRVAPAHKICVVRNGIDIQRFHAPADADRVRAELGIPADAPVVGTVGRLTEIKRQDLLVRAFAKLDCAAHLLLVGDGPARADLEALTQNLGVAGRVHFIGYQAQPERFLPALDVFALTSRSEGIPLAILEAWAAGVAVVAARVGGVPELITHGQNGLLFESGDESALVAGLGRLLGDRLFARELSAAGRRRALDEFSLARMARTYHDHYTELLTRPDVAVRPAAAGFVS